ncbi:ABC transporter permease [Bacillus sp. FSL W7-1360]
MKDALTLWHERKSNYWKEARGYLRFILNSGFVVSLYFLFIFLTIYYQRFVETMPEHFPVALLLTLLFTWRLTAGGVRTFVKQADIVFLLPYEARMQPYFARAVRYSMLWQLAYIIVLMMAAGPLFTARIGEGAVFWLALVVLLALKSWNVLAVWQEQRLPSKGERVSHICLRLLLNGVTVYLLFVKAPYWLVLGLLVFMVLLYVLYWRGFSLKYTLKWARLIEVESSMLMFFYRIANAFIDVPQLQQQVRERKYASFMIPFLGGKKRTVYSFLYARTFLRANDYVGTYVRLLFVGGIVLYIVPTGWLQVAIALLFIHMTMMQLSTLSFHYVTNMWVDLYPVRVNESKTALTMVVLRLLVVQVVLFSFVIVLTQAFLHAGVMLVAGSLFAVYGSYTLIHRKKGKYRRVR